MKLNNEQRESVAHDGNLCLTACPGSGKTRTILAKLLRCVEQVRDTARRIACITYTHAAVDEIEMRVRQYGASGDEEYCEISTIHSFCLTNILQPFHYFLPELASGFEVLSPDSEHWHELVTSLADRHGIARKHIDGFSNIQRRPDGTVFSPKGIPLQVAAELVAYLDQHSLVSFPDIVYHSVRLASSNIFIARGLACRFAWILIDEFQDTSDGQVALLRLIGSQNRAKFFLVGDPNQSIMTFAGAHPSLMGIFANEINARRDVKLIGNYRCSERIVEHAERLITSVPAMSAIGMNKNFAFVPRYVHVADSTEAIFDYFLPTVDELGISLGEAAVLAPWSFSLYRLAGNLRERGIPVIGPGARPYRRSHLLAGLAEHLCAHTEDDTGIMFRSLQRALFLLLLDVTGEPQWRVFAYEGRRCLCGLAAMAKRVKEYSGGAAIAWLKAMADQIAQRLVTAEFMPQGSAHCLQDSAQAMIHDMERNKVDTANLSVSDIGLYARPRHCLQLMTMHAAKGREFDAVAIIDLHDGRVPDYRCQTEAEFSEARRLLYVAVTRARKCLMYCTDASDDRNTPSRFLREMGLTEDN